MKYFFTILISLVIGATATWVTMTDEQNNLILDGNSNEVEDIEQKIEEINQLQEAPPFQANGDLESLFGNCDIEGEKAAYEGRRSCNRRLLKAESYWTNMYRAEAAVLLWLKSGNYAKLLAHTSCEAYDLTWYEMHCEADRINIVEGHFKNLVSYLSSNDMSTLSNAKWVRKKPDLRKLRNPGWIWRSRLVLKGFQLNGPWAHNAHPTENETVILLEQKIGGRIYIVGIPVTGVNLE